MYLRSGICVLSPGAPRNLTVPLYKRAWCSAIAWKHDGDLMSAEYIASAKPNIRLQ